MTDEPTRSARPTLLVRAGTAVWLALGVVLLVLALRGARPAAATAARTPGDPPASARDTAAGQAEAYVPDDEFRTGDEVVLVFIGASFCGAQHKPGFPQAVERAKLALAKDTKARGMQFRAHAVSLDWKPAEALTFLSHFGAFDEISVGSNWLNDGAVRYIWRDLPSEPAVPQVVVIQRRIEKGAVVGIRDERVVRRLLGTEQITRWADAGARI